MPVQIATVVALRADRVLLVRQPRMHLSALPGGKLERGESPREAARRELAEETGIVLGPGDLTDLGLTLHVREDLALRPFAILDPPRPAGPAELPCDWVALTDLDRAPLAPAVAQSVHAALARLALPERPDGPVATTLIDWWEHEHVDRPWRATRDPYAVLVCEVMSQQTQLERVAVYWARWLERWPTAQSLAQASLADVLAMWQGLGYPRRARDLHATARTIAATGWPSSERLTDLPGVGPYTADAIRCFALEQPVLPLDANVRRVLARRFPSGLHPDGAAWLLGQATMELGQRHCRARPRCESCPLRAGCLVALAAHDAEGNRWDPASRPRRQAPYRGSLRERRGRLLAATLAGEQLQSDLDPTAAASLIADGLLVSVDGRLQPPERP